MLGKKLGYLLSGLLAPWFCLTQWQCNASSEPADACEDGAEGCACFSNETCFAGLECNDGVCQAGSTTSAGGDTSTSGTTSTSAAGGTDTTTASGGAGGDPGSTDSTSGVGASPGCDDDADCDPARVCAVASGTCVDCVDDSDCETGLSCRATVCRASCESDADCPSGQCDTGLGLCVDCSVDDDCTLAQFCNFGQCVADSCVPGHTVCSENAVAECDATGRTYEVTASCTVGQTCVVGSAGAECVDWVCTAGATECEDSSTLIECSADGLSVLTSVDCAETSQYCNVDTCSDLLCQPDSYACKDGQSTLCSADGLSETVLPCSVTQYCDAVSGQCVERVCEPNQPACDGDFATTCDTLGAGYTGSGVECEAGTCLDGVCQGVIFADDFEDQSFVDWPKSVDYALTGSVTSAAAADDSGYGLNLTGAGAYYSGIHHDFEASQPSYVSVWMRTDSSIVNSGHFFLASRTTAGTYIWVAYVIFMSSGNIGVTDGTSTVALSPYAANQWYHLEIDLDWTTMTADYSVNGLLSAADFPMRSGQVYDNLTRVYLFNVDQSSVDWDEIVIR